MHCRGEKTRRKKPGGFRKKIKIPESEISENEEQKLKSKIGKIFVNEKTLEEYSVTIYEIDSYFYEYYEEKIRVDKSGRNYILFRTDVYFFKYNLAEEVDEKGHTDRDLIFEKNRQEVLEKNLNCTFIRINTVKENYDADYEIGRMQTFISEQKNNKLRELEKENEELKKKLQKMSKKIRKTNISPKQKMEHT